MLHVKTAQTPYHHRFDVRQVSEEFIDHISLFNDLQLKNVFVSNYNDWAQRSNSLLRSLRDKESKWQKVSSHHQKFAKVQTVAYILTCFICFLEGSWCLALFAIIAHIFAVFINRILDAKAIASTRVKRPLKCIFLNISKMKSSLARIETGLQLSYNFPLQGASKNKPIVGTIEDSPCHHIQDKVSLLNAFCVVVNALSGITAFVAIYSIYTWISGNFCSYILLLLVVTTFFLVTNHAILAFRLVRHAASDRGELAAGSYVFLKRFEDWVEHSRIRIHFCHYKFCLLNLTQFEEQICCLDDLHCTLLTVWFLTSIERLLSLALRNGNSHSEVLKLFSNIQVDDASFLDAQYIVRRLQSVLRTSLPKSDSYLKYETTTARGCSSKNSNSPTREHVFMPKPSSTTYLNPAICTDPSVCSYHFENLNTINPFLISRPVMRSTCSARYVSSHSRKSRNSKHVKASRRAVITPVSPTNGNRTLRDGIKDFSPISAINDITKRTSLSERKSSLSSESITSSIEVNCSLDISAASESSISSKESQRPHCSLVEKECKCETCLCVSDPETAQLDKNSPPCLEPVDLKNNAETYSSKIQQHNQLKSEQDNLEYSTTSSKASVKSSSEEAPAAEKHIFDCQGTSAMVYSNAGLASAVENLVCATNGELPDKTWHHEKDVEDTEEEEEESVREEENRECWEDFRNNSDSPVDRDPPQVQPELSSLTDTRNPSITSKAMKMEDQELSTIPRTDRVFVSSGNDSSRKEVNCGEKFNSCSLNSEPLPSYQDFSHSISLAERHSNSSSTRKLYADRSYQRKKSGNDDFKISRSCSSPDCSSVRGNEFLLSRTVSEKCITLRNKYQINNGTFDAKDFIKDTAFEQLHFSSTLGERTSSDVDKKATKSFSSKLWSMSDNSIPVNNNQSSKRRDSRNIQTNFFKVHSTGDFTSTNPLKDVVFRPVMDVSYAPEQSHMPFVPQEPHISASQQSLISGSQQSRISVSQQSCISASRSCRSLTSEENSGELSFPVASSDDENFRFHAESGCTTDTPYSEQHSCRLDSPTLAWKYGGKKEDEPDSTTNLPKSGFDTEPKRSAARTKGTFKFDNLDFGFDLDTGSENVTLKFYCESEGEYTESMSSPTKGRKRYNTSPEKWRSEFQRKVPDPFENWGDKYVPFRSSFKNIPPSEQITEEANISKSIFSKDHSDSETRYNCTDYLLQCDNESYPCHSKVKRELEFNVEGITFNFKRRKNSGPVKLQYHRRDEARDFLFKSRFKRFRFRCGNNVPSSGEPYEDPEQQVPDECSYEEGHSENEECF